MMIKINVGLRGGISNKMKNTRRKFYDAGRKHFSGIRKDAAASVRVSR
jgi:hypothetical protein